MNNSQHRSLHLDSDLNKRGRHCRTWSKNTMSQPGGVIIAVVQCSGPYVTPSLKHTHIHTHTHTHTQTNTHTQETELLFHEIIKRETVLLSWCQSEQRVLIQFCHIRPSTAMWSQHNHLNLAVELLSTRT